MNILIIINHRTNSNDNDHQQWCNFGVIEGYDKSSVNDHY